MPHRLRPNETPAPIRSLADDRRAALLDCLAAEKLYKLPAGFQARGSDLVHAPGTISKLIDHDLMERRAKRRRFSKPRSYAVLTLRGKWYARTAFTERLAAGHAFASNALQEPERS